MALQGIPGRNCRQLPLGSASFLAATALAFWMNRGRVRIFIRLPVSLLFVVIAVMCSAAGCGGDASGVLGDRANFRKFSVYYVGDSFHGHGLNSQQSPDSEEQAGRAVDFLYGDCKPEGDAGCPAPLEIETFAECARPQYPRSLPSRARRLRIRGVPAALFGPGDWIELYTGNVTVVIHADGGVTLMRQAAQALRSADGRIGPDDPLPAPSRKAGRSPC